MILNLAGVAFAITAIVLYGVYLGDIYYWMNSYYNYNYYYNCYNDYNGYNGYNGYGYGRHTTRHPSLEEKLLQEKCLEGEAVLRVS